MIMTGAIPARVVALLMDVNELLLLADLRGDRRRRAVFGALAQKHGATLHLLPPGAKNFKGGWASMPNCAACDRSDPPLVCDACRVTAWCDKACRKADARHSE